MPATKFGARRTYHQEGLPFLRAADCVDFMRQHRQEKQVGERAVAILDRGAEGTVHGDAEKSRSSPSERVDERCE